MVLIYEHGSNIYSTFDEIHEYVINNKNLADFKTATIQHVKNLIDLETNSYKILKSNLNIVEKGKDFFEKMRHNLNEMNNLEMGDIIFFNRGIYSHSAILKDCESFQVIHKNSKHSFPVLIENYLNQNSDKAGEIRINYILDVIDSSKIDKSNLYDDEHPPLYDL